MQAKGITDDEVIDAFRRGGSNNKAAAILGVDVRGLLRRKARLALKGFAPECDMTHPVPDGFAVAGYSMYHAATQTQPAYWLKAREDKATREALMQEAFDAMAAKLPRLSALPAPKTCVKDLLNCFIITDYHLGMLAWGEETRGEPWDLSIAEKLLIDWFRVAIERAPAAEHAVFAQLGDFVHFDGLDAVTPEHRNLLDADTRYQKVVRSAIRVLRQCVEMLRAKHKHVTVIMAEGNHDVAGSVWLREWFSAMYEKEPRVTVDTSPDPYYCVAHGETTLFFHHGHKANMKQVAAVFAGKFRRQFGQSGYVYAHLGHLHKNEMDENNLMIVERHRTLAAADAYASRGGWLSGRDAKVITYSKRFGEVSRIVLSPDAVRG